MGDLSGYIKCSGFFPKSFFNEKNEVSNFKLCKRRTSRILVQLFSSSARAVRLKSN
uniref:Uncharacterized protein n=1 Tax=Macrostomum lignano TaxID=282301 RepID=A0A1I8H0Y5_9PLAT